MSSTQFSGQHSRLALLPRRGGDGNGSGGDGNGGGDGGGRPISNLSVEGVEITQGIQVYPFNGQGGTPPQGGVIVLNSVPLIALKPTILRVYVNVSRNRRFPIPTSVTGLVSTGGGALNRQPINGPIPAMDQGAIDRGNANHTLNFRLEPGECKPGIQGFSVTVFDPSHPGDPAYSSPPALFYNVKFEDVPQPKVYAVLVHYTGVDYNDRPVDAQPSFADFVSTVDFVRQIYPVNDINYQGWTVIEWQAKTAIEDNFRALYAQIARMRAMSGTDDIYVGMLPPQASCGGVCGVGGNGAALTYPISTGQSGRPEAFGACHEIGHAFGRAHAPCGNPPGPDPNYPNYISCPQGSIGEYGFDPSSSTVFDPHGTFDFMSYCSPVWVSPYTYMALKEKIAGQFRTAAIVASPGESASSARPEEAPMMHLFLRLHRNGQYGRIQVLDAFHLPRRLPRATLTQPSDVIVECLTSDGVLIAMQRCATQDLHTDLEAPYHDFLAIFPYMDGIASVRVVRHGQVITTLQVSASPPPIGGVTFERRDKNLLRLTWSAGATPDAEHAPTYSVRYSHDGGHSWRTLASGLGEREYIANLESLPGGQECRFQILALAGFQTAVIETETLEVDRKPRQAFIITPRNGEEFSQGTSIELAGAAFSPNFGNPHFDDALWTSHVAGMIGTGRRAVVDALPIGFHRITLRLPDGMGGESFSTVGIRIHP